MARFIQKSGLKKALDNRDWEAFARGYNGAGYRRNAYHTKLAAAYQRHGGEGGAVEPAEEPVERRILLGRGSAGEAVRDLQRNLSALGYPLAVDGIFGRDTEKAVHAFQRDHRLDADGIVGPRTFAAIGAALPFGGNWLTGLWQWLARWLAHRPS
jgi:N-acetyl-anhydromuramyl-L-alanine amidase AmpD